MQDVCRQPSNCDSAACFFEVSMQYGGGIWVGQCQKRSDCFISAVTSDLFSGKYEHVSSRMLKE